MAEWEAVLVDYTQVWRGFFQNWPKDMNRRGVIVTKFGEQIVFVSFLTTDTLLMIQRQAPDSVGARSVVLPFDEIHALKVTDPVKPQVYSSVGFRGAAATK